MNDLQYLSSNSKRKVGKNPARPSPPPLGEERPREEVGFSKFVIFCLGQWTSIREHWRHLKIVWVVPGRESGRHLGKEEARVAGSPPPPATHTQSVTRFLLGFRVKAEFIRFREN